MYNRLTSRNTSHREHILLPWVEPGSWSSGTFLTSVSLCFAVIRAKAVSEKEVDSGNDIYGNPIKRIQYEIKQIKVP